MSIAALVSKFVFDVSDFSAGTELVDKSTAKMSQSMAAAEARAARLAKAMDTSNATMGMSANQAKIFRLEQDGASQKTVAHLRALDMESQRLKDRDASMAKSVNTMKSVAVGLATIGAAAIAAGIAITTSLVTGAMANIDRTAKTADKLGVPIEALTKLRYAADLAGVANESLDKSLQKFVLNVADASKGTGAAKNALNELGLSANQLKDMTPDQALGVVADKLNLVQGQSDKARLAFDLFGKEGVGMLNVLASGSQGLDEAGAKLERMGGVFSRLDAAKVEAANDAITDLKYLTTSAGQQLAIELAPYITATATKLWDMATAGEGMGTKITGAVQWVTMSVANLADYWELLKGGFYVLQTAILVGLTEALRLFDVLGETITWISNKVTGSRDQWISFSQAVGNEAQAAADKAKAAFKSFSEGTNSKAATQFFADINKAAEESASKIAEKAAKNAAAGGQGDVTADVDKLKKLDDALKQIDGELAKLGLSELEIKIKGLEGLQLAGERLEEYSQKLRDIENAKSEKDRTAKQTEAIKALDDQLAKAGMNEAERKLFDYEKLGFYGKSLEEIQEKIKSIDILTKASAADKSIEDLETKVKNFGLSEKDRTVMQMQEDGLDPEKIQRYVSAHDRLQQLEAGKESKDKQPRLVLAGSAEAQRLSYMAGRGTADTDTIPQKQLSAQERTAKGVEQLAAAMRPGVPGSTATLELVEIP